MGHFESSRKYFTVIGTPHDLVIVVEGISSYEGAVLAALRLDSS